MKFNWLQLVFRCGFLVLLSMFVEVSVFAQIGNITGNVTNAEGPVAYASITLNGERVEYTDNSGTFRFENVELGSHSIQISYIGYQTYTTEVVISENDLDKNIECYLEPSLMTFDEIVVTGTKTFKRQTKSAVIVNVVDSKTLEEVQACNLSEGLRFQPGLRVETDCQTCNYTQLRMNGLAGGYSQILINGRPIFSPLTGLYGLEQLPVNMIDRIEVIRGGGSSLYGSSAIGGTVNVLTKIPSENSLSIGSSYQSISGSASDYMVTANGTFVNAKKDKGISVFFNHRDREMYDHNEDNFSEIPEVKNTSIGLTAFVLPNENQKLEFSLSNLNEYRYGGEMVDGITHFALQAEERDHDVWMGSLDYQINFNDGKSNLITYMAMQYTDRDHYTGVVPDEGDEEAYVAHFESPPYGTSVTKTLQAGIQLNHRLNKFLSGTNVLTLGSEYLLDDTFDEIPAYNYLIDQNTKNVGVFIQSDWEILPSLNLLSGIRMDYHNLIDNLVASPRVSLLYRYKENTQFRFSYGNGFRAPQAFDADLHIAFAGGGVSRVVLDEDLIEENSKSYSLSLNYDKPTENWVAGFTIEGFYTRLNNAFALIPIGEDSFGEVFEKRNGQGATVQGLNLEARANFKRKIQLESGFTLQTSMFDEKVQYIDELEGIRDFIRTPNFYGFANLSITPGNNFKANLNYVYTGSMKVPHFAGAPNQLTDEIIDSPQFSNLSLKLSYGFNLTKSSELELYAGVRNILNSYQSNFDIGKNRDSNFVFGPAQPRTIFFGMKYSL